MAPAALNDSQTFVLVKIGKGAMKKVGRRDEVRIEDCNELFFRIFERSLQGASLESISTLSAQDFYLEMFLLVFRDNFINFQDRIIVRIVKQQDARFFFSICFCHNSTGSYQPSNDISLIVNRQLD